MQIIFQVITVLIVAAAAFFSFRGGGARHQAIRRIALLLFIVAIASSVFFPGIWTWLANIVGIGRGADLLLYLMVLVFLAFVASTYRRFRTLQNEITLLARELALSRADSSNLPNASEEGSE